LKITKEKVKNVLLQAIAGFIFWTGTLTPYMLFVVGVSAPQYFKWFGMQLIIVPPLAPLSIWFINWFIKIVSRKQR